MNSLIWIIMTYCLISLIKEKTPNCKILYFTCTLLCGPFINDKKWWWTERIMLHLLASCSWARRWIHRLCSHALVPSPGAVGGRHMLRPAGRYLGNRLCVCGTPDGPGTVAGEVWRRSAVPNQENARYVSEEVECKKF